MIELIPSIALCAWILEERHAFDQTVLGVAVQSQNLDFITLPRVDRIVASFWKREDTRPSSPWQSSYLLLPDARLLLERAFFVCFLALYCVVVLLHRPLHSELHPVEIFMYIVGCGYVLSKRQLFTSMIRGWCKTNLTKTSNSSTAEHSSSDDQSGSGDNNDGEGSLSSSWRVIDMIFCIALINIFFLRLPPW